MSSLSTFYLIGIISQNFQTSIACAISQCNNSINIKRIIGKYSNAPNDDRNRSNRLAYKKGPHLLISSNQSRKTIDHSLWIRLPFWQSLDRSFCPSSLWDWWEQPMRLPWTVPTNLAMWSVHEGPATGLEIIAPMRVTRHFVRPQMFAAATALDPIGKWMENANDDLPVRKRHLQQQEGISQQFWIN